MKGTFLIHTSIFSLILATVCSPAFSQQDKEIRARAVAILKKMTLEEKLSYIGGQDKFNIRGIPRLGLPVIRMADGPQGVRGNGKSTAYPSGIGLAATWNEELAFRYGASLANDARAREIDIMLGPGVNIYRSPLNGRNFEYFGEDPYLASRTAVNYIKGMQKQGVTATVKHFVANNQEWDRHRVSSNIDERTLNEIYFPAFYHAVTEANVGAVMNSYNLLNGIHTSQHKWLLTDVLRDQWKFKGILMSDWGSTYSGAEAANAGLDLEMPDAKFMSPDSLRIFLKKGIVTESTIDSKVLHILETLIRVGFLDRKPEVNRPELNNISSNQTALDVARESVVLLKNEGKLLPLDLKKVRTIAVVGQNANRFVTGGGSGWVDPHSYSTVYSELAAAASRNGVKIVYYDFLSTFRTANIFADKDRTVHGMRAELFNNKELKGAPVLERTDTILNFDSGKNPIQGVPKENFSARWTGYLQSDESSAYEFRLAGDDGYRLIIDGKTLIERWAPGSKNEQYVRVNLEAGKLHQVVVEFFQGAKSYSVDFGWREVNNGKVLEQLSATDLIVACVGFDDDTEREGKDRTFELPAKQQEALDLALQANKPTVAVLNAGGNVYMQDWIQKVKGLLWAWYPGQDGGKAITEILLGQISPSGKLPVTFEKRWEDNPVYNSYHARDNKKEVEYSEGIFVGYRGYDKLKRDVQYPFGFGLSYTAFEIKNVKVLRTKVAGQPLKVTCTVTNKGARRGAEVVQLYIGKPSDRVEQPEKELKGYVKVWLNAGESKTITLDLTGGDLQYYDIQKRQFVSQPGNYKVMVGTSSRDIIFSQAIRL